jgi:hypothetical protein
MLLEEYGCHLTGTVGKGRIQSAITKMGNSLISPTSYVVSLVLLTLSTHHA